MPTYEYECKRCGHAFERFQGIKDEPLKRCPECKGKVERLIGIGAGVIFKGSGFYTTDYRSESYLKAAKKDTASTSGDAGKGSSDKTAAAKPSEPAKAANSASKGTDKA